MKIGKIISSLNNPGENLRQRVVRGGFWVFSLRIINRGFSLIRLIILARILSPNDFGLMGIALLVMATLDTFSQTGFQQALIQKKKDIKIYLNTAWAVLILRNLILFAILFFIAPYAATFFNAPETKPIIQVIGIAILLQAFTNIGVIYFQKELEFNKQFIYQLSGTLADFIVAISAALILRSVWALVFGLFAGNAVKCLVSYLIHPYRPRLSFNLEKAKELFGFGRWVLGSSILIFLITQGDDIFVGKILGATALGFYQMAYRISNMPATEITHVISQVTFPTYSKLQDDIPKLRKAYLKVLQITAFLSFPIAGMIFILAPDFTKIFLGEKWMPMVPAMQILALAGLIRALQATTGSLFYSIGKPKIDTKWQILRLTVLLIFIYYSFIISWDITGVSIAVLLSIFVSTFGFYYDLIKTLNIKVIKLLDTFSLPMISEALSIFIVYIVRNNIYIDIWGLIILSIFNLSLYLLCIFIFDSMFNQNIKMMIKDIWKILKEV